MNIFSLQAHLILEKDEKFDLSEFNNEIIEKYNNRNISTQKYHLEYIINGRKNLIKGCIK